MENNSGIQFIKRATIIVTAEEGDFGFEVSPEFGLFITKINVLAFNSNSKVPEYIFVSQEYYDLINQLSFEIDTSSFRVDEQSLVFFCKIYPYESEYEDGPIIRKLMDMPKPKDY